MLDHFPEVKAKVPASLVLERVLGPSQRGKWICPFHDDHNPSLSEKGGGIVCWAGCFTGDIFKFLQAHLHLDALASLQFVAEVGGVILDLSPLSQSPPKLNLETFAFELTSDIDRMGREIESAARRDLADGWRKAHRLFAEGEWEAATELIGNVLLLERAVGHESVNDEGDSG